MMKLISSIVNLAASLRQIGKLTVAKQLKTKIRNTYVQAIFLKRFDSRNSVVHVAGYKVKYCTYRSFTYLFREIFLNQEYQFRSESKRPFIIDCGSNIGMSVLYFKLTHPNSEILAFEPDPDAFGCLKANVEMNDLDAVHVYQKALAEKEGAIDFYYNEENPGSLGMSSIRERLPNSKRTVDAVRLSAYIDRDVDFLKMDIEGSEFAVMEELGKSGKLPFIKQMVIEYHHHILAAEDALSRMLRLLEDAGFGYQIESGLSRPLARNQFQDILIYAYQK